MSQARDRRNVFILAVCQVLSGSGRTLISATSPLIAIGIAPDKALATLPITFLIVGTAMTTYPASMLMRWTGRRVGFVIGSLIGTLGGTFCVGGLLRGDFWIFAVGSFFFGVFLAFTQLYRFAATDVVPDDFKAKAIALVLAGGVVAAFTGPELAKVGKDLFASVEFLGAYVILMGLTLTSALVVTTVNIPKLSHAQVLDPGRPLGEIMRRPAFIVAVLSATVAQGVMNLLMTATPLAMLSAKYAFADTALVIEWHSFAMFAPGFFTGIVIRRVGAVPVILVGFLVQLAAIGVALSGLGLGQFWLAMFLVGLGWNFAFVGGSTLLTTVHTPSERAKTQGINNFIIFSTVAIGSFSSGALHHFFGWEWVNLAALPLVAIAFLVVGWYGLTERRRRAE